MSEKYFKVLSRGFDEEGNPLYLIKDTTDIIRNMIGNYEICKKVIEQQAIINDLNGELEKSSTFIIEQREEIKKLHYQIIELQDKLGMSEKQHDLKQIIELQNENIISKKKIKDLQVSLFLQSKELERQKRSNRRVGE